MTAYILLAGTLFFRTPERRISKAGKPFATDGKKIGLIFDENYKGNGRYAWEAATAYIDEVMADRSTPCDT